ncbi:hypothetical protein HMPREF1028_00758 [Neisseria sp. GT4A_CT1]|nr:hypothetical protein HMPREF1028_00758 [Neisseria sp. GT4A_CT1]
MFINSTRHLSYQFQHTAARRRLGLPTLYSCLNDRFQHTAARRRLGRRWEKRWYALPPVSTHSRPKAAGTSFKQLEKEFYVSTHSRPKAAGRRNAELQAFMAVSTHSRPKAAGFIKHHMHIRCIGFNTQPPEGGWSWKNGCVPMSRVSTHSRPKAAGHCALFFMCLFRMFQHTAARRRLVQNIRIFWNIFKSVSTHSRPKAAGYIDSFCYFIYKFQHTAARRRLVYEYLLDSQKFKFQHTAARRRLDDPVLKQKAANMFQHTAARRRLDSSGV